MTEISEASQCIQCGVAIDPTTLSFEQKLIDDKDFCRRCWNQIMSDVDDIRLPHLAVADVD